MSADRGSRKANGWRGQAVQFADSRVAARDGGVGFFTAVH